MVSEQVDIHLEPEEGEAEELKKEKNDDFGEVVRRRKRGGVCVCDHHPKGTSRQEGG